VLALTPYSAPTAVAAEESDYTRVIPLIYEDVQDFDNGLAAVKLDGKWGFIDKTGTMVIKAEYDYVAG
jgi:hypothetical protein